MSWNFRKAGLDVAALKAAVRNESAPESVKDEICSRLDGIAERPAFAGPFVVVVETHGHTEGDPARPWKHVSDIKISVGAIPLTVTV